MTDMAPQEHAGLSPLIGVRIVDFSSNIAGPFATMILAQLGADVVKVEAPAGDDARAWSVQDGTSLVHSYVNAGKRGVMIDLKTAEGREAAHALCAAADVMLQSMRPGVAARLGLDARTLHELNPDLLCYDLSGYGSGPLGQTLPGYDPLVQASCGIVAMNGHEGDDSSRCAPSVIDLGTGQWIALGIMAAIMSRRQGQPVRHMETALADTAFSLVAYQASAARMTGKRPPRAGSGNPIAAPYEAFRTSNGELLVAAPSQRLWERLTEALDAPELRSDPRYATALERVAHRAALNADLAKRLTGQTTDFWIERLRAHGIPVAEIAGLERAVAGPIAKERETFTTLDGIPLVRLPWIVEGRSVPWARPAPRLGEHTEEVLSELETKSSRTIAEEKDQ